MKKTAPATITYAAVKLPASSQLLHAAYIFCVPPSRSVFNPLVIAAAWRLREFLITKMSETRETLT